MSLSRLSRFYRRKKVMLRARLFSLGFVRDLRRRFRKGRQNQTIKIITVRSDR